MNLFWTDEVHTPINPTRLWIPRFGRHLRARDPMRSYFGERQKNEIYFLIEFCIHVTLKAKLTSNMTPQSTAF